MWRLYPEEIPPLQLQQLITQKHTQQGPSTGPLFFAPAVCADAQVLQVSY
jgi:hypothetical protein